MKHELPASHVRLKRAYEPAAPEDGVRVLVDRIAVASAGIDQIVHNRARPPARRRHRDRPGGYGRGDAAQGRLRPRAAALRRRPRKAAVERFQALSGSGDARGATGIEGVVRAAYQGRIELLTADEAVWGSYDEAADEVATGARFAETGQDLLDAAAVRTLRHGGSVHVLPRGEMPEDVPVAAILRY